MPMCLFFPKGSRVEIPDQSLAGLQHKRQGEREWAWIVWKVPLSQLAQATCAHDLTQRVVLVKIMCVELKLLSRGVEARFLLISQGATRQKKIQNRIPAFSDECVNLFVADAPNPCDAGNFTPDYFPTFPGEDTLVNRAAYMVSPIFMPLLAFRMDGREDACALLTVWTDRHCDESLSAIATTPLIVAA